MNKEIIGLYQRTATRIKRLKTELEVAESLLSIKLKEVEDKLNGFSLEKSYKHSIDIHYLNFQINKIKQMVTELQNISMEFGRIIDTSEAEALIQHYHTLQIEFSKRVEELEEQIKNLQEIKEKGQKPTIIYKD